MATMRRALFLVLTISTAIIALVFMAVAISTDYWLYSIERVETSEKVIRNVSSNYTLSYSGLWRVCQRTSRKSRFLDATDAALVSCRQIRHFLGEDADSSTVMDSIVALLEKSIIFPFAGLFLLLISCFLTMGSCCCQRRKCVQFVSGILCILSGLCSLAGIITYIASVTEEVGNKPKNQTDEPKFVYIYGWSFFLAVSSFGMSEFSGVLSIYFYIARHQTDYKSKQERRSRNQQLQQEHQLRPLAHPDSLPLQVVHRPCRPDTADSRASRSRSASRSRDRDVSRGSSPELNHYGSYRRTTPQRERDAYSLSNLPRDYSRMTVSTTAEYHREPAAIDFHRDYHQDYVRRTTPV